MSPELAAAFGEEVTALAICWRMTRGDGVVLGFTSHDRDLVVDGVIHRARPGMTPSAVSQTAELRADSMQVEGALVASAISAFDLEAGKWAAARVELFACDWGRPELGAIRLMRGEIGEVLRPHAPSAGSFRVELLSDVVRLERMGPLRVAPMCRAELGDGRCGVDMDGRRLELAVVGGGLERILLEAAPVGAERFAGGRMRILSGPLCGIDRRVAGIEGPELILEEDVPPRGAAGARIWLWEGCDKRLRTCADRFENVAAFDGEPHVPGTDALLRYVEG